MDPTGAALACLFVLWAMLLSAAFVGSIYLAMLGAELAIDGAYGLCRRLKCRWSRIRGVA